MDEGRMARDVEILRQVMETHGLNVHQLANRSGLAEKSIYKYLGDVRTLPSDVLRAAFEITHDWRLVQLITGAVPVHLVVERPKPNKSDATSSQSPHAMQIPPLEEVLPEVLKAVGELSDCGQFLIDIMADGRIDRSDLGTMDRFQEHLATARRKLSVCQSAVETAREGIAQ